MRTIKFAWMPTRTIDGVIWGRFYKEYRSPNNVLRIPFVLQDQYDAGTRREFDPKYPPGAEVHGYGPT